MTPIFDQQQPRPLSPDLDCGETYSESSGHSAFGQRISAARALVVPLLMLTLLATDMLYAQSAEDALHTLKSTFRLFSRSNSVLDAGQQISFQPGFSVPVGAQLSCRIQSIFK
jgi:hypothetical protein